MERYVMEDLGVGMRIILKLILKTLRKGVDWINLAQDNDRRRALANWVKKPNR